MWNALKFRVDSFQVSFKDGATLAKLNLGLTDYASYQGSSSLGKEYSSVLFWTDH